MNEEDKVKNLAKLLQLFGNKQKVMVFANTKLKCEALQQQLATRDIYSTVINKDFDPEFVASETEARIAEIEKENIELGRLGKTQKNVPQYISMSQLTPEVMAKAEEDIKAELKAEGKPEKIWDRIVPGKLERFVSDNTTLDNEKALLDQVFIMDESLNVAKYVESKGDARVVGFKRVSLA